jgi:hypothetical protein
MSNGIPEDGGYMYSLNRGLEKKTGTFGGCDCDDKTVMCGRNDCINKSKDPVKPTTKSQKLADDHWAYIKDLLVIHGMTDIEIKTIGFHYKTAFVHGWKHGVEFWRGIR